MIVNVPPKPVEPVEEDADTVPEPEVLVMDDEAKAAVLAHHPNENPEDVISILVLNQTIV